MKPGDLVITRHAYGGRIYTSTGWVYDNSVGLVLDPPYDGFTYNVKVLICGEVTMINITYLDVISEAG